MSDRIIGSEKRICLAKIKIEEKTLELMALLGKTRESIVKEKKWDLCDISPYLSELRDFQLNIPCFLKSKSRYKQSTFTKF